MSIPLQDLLLVAAAAQKAAAAGRAERAGWRAWAAAWSRPLTYRASIRAAALGRPLARYERDGARACGAGPTGARRRSRRPRSFMQRWKAGEV